MIDLRPDLLAIVSAILKEQVPDCEVRAFGSRVSWTAKEHSDLDLVVRCEKRLTLKKLAAIKEAFEESELPIRVDVLDWHAISESFRKVIEKNCEVIQRGKDGEGGMTVLHKPSTATQLPSNWSWKRLDEICEGIFDCPHSTPVLSEEGPYLARSQDMRLGVFRTDEAAHVSQETFNDRIVRAKPRHGDLLYSREGTYFGIAAEVPANIRVCLGQRMVLIRPNPSIVSFRFLRFWLNSPVMALHTGGQRDGSVAERLNLPTIRALPIAVPPLPEQRAIAHILGTLDDKIELNRRMNETLEAMARALFTSWFVDFEPVRAKAEGRAPGLPRHLADLFPNRLVDSEFGEIPQGWEVKQLPEVIEVNPVRILRKNEMAPYLDMANMPTRGHSPDALIERPYGSGMRFMNGDTLIARITPCLENGKTAFVDFLTDDKVGWGSTEYVVFRPKPPLPEEFGYCLARSDAFRDFAIQSMTGSSGRQRVPVESLSHFRLVDAPKSVVELFGRLVKPLFARGNAMTEESRILAALRDTLLPKLISGELRLKDAMSIIGGVA